MRNYLLTLLGLSLAACGSSPLQSSIAPVDPTVTEPATTVCGVANRAQHCDQSITSPAPQERRTAQIRPTGDTTSCDYTGSSGDTTRIDATIFMPAHNEGETFPLILHSHGWGNSRASAPSATPPTEASNTFEGIADNIPTLVANDYIVLSYDQRGWGTSEGQAAVISPCYEVVDAMAIIDWAIENLPVDTSDGDIVLGAIGGSYGGAYQLMLASQDPRVDSIMPVATWNQLAQIDNQIGASPATLDASTFHGALVTNEVIKRGYVNGLCLLASPAQAGARLDPAVQAACDAIQLPPGSAQNGQQLDDVDTDLRELFGYNGYGQFDTLRTGLPTMDVDAWIVQGTRDMVFDGIEAYDNYQLLSDSNNNAGDVRFMTTDGGHMLTTFDLVQNAVNPASNYQKQGDNDCGPHGMFGLMTAWFDETLKGITPANPVPALCLGLDSDDGVDSFSSVPLGNSLGAYTIPATDVSTTSATNRDIIGSPRQFLELATLTTDGYLAGIPVLDNLVVEASASGIVVATGVDATAFFAIGIEKADGSFIEVDEQVAAVRRANAAADTAITYNNLRMPMVGEKISNGDKLGLLLYQRHGFYELVPGDQATEYLSNAYQISGEIEIPVFDSSNQLILP